MAEAGVEIPVTVEQTDAPVEIKIDDKGASDAPKIVTADEGIKSLKEEAEKARRESAARLAEKDRIIQETFRRAQAAEQEVHSVRKDQVGTIIDSLTKDKEAARRDYKLAMEAGDFDKAADAQDRLSLANARIVEAERGKMALESEPAANGRSLAQPVYADEVEKVARSMTSQRSADWIRAHPEHVVNGAVSQEALRAHSAAIGEAIEPDTDEYFSFLERRLGTRRAPQQERQTAPRESARTSTSAPVSRDPIQSSGERPGVIKLTGDEVKAAMETIAPLYPNESRQQILQRYARNKQDLIAEGRMGRT